MAECMGVLTNEKNKASSRLGRKFIRAEANTWKTFASAVIFADGSGFVKVMRGNEILGLCKFEKEE